MDATKWFHLVGLISAIALGIGFVAALVSVGLSWRINEQQKLEIEQVKGDVAKQQERAAIAEKELLELQQDLQPRDFTPAQKEQILSVLRKGPKGRVELEYVSFNTESNMFTVKLFLLFQEADWEIGGFDPGVDLGILVGMMICVKDATNPPAHAATVRNAILAAGIGIGDGGCGLRPVPDGVVRLRVGLKPGRY